MERPKNIHLYLKDGDTNGRIKCTLANWTGIGYKIPRTMIEKSKEIEYMNQTGVYFLFGHSDETGEPLVYIGQAGTRKNGQAVLARIMEHKNNKEKDYWTEAVVLTTSNNSFGPTEISYLENNFCNMAKEAKRYIVKNENEPTQGNITEEKESEMLEFIDYSKLIIGALGYKIFEPLISKNKEKNKEPILYLKRNGLDVKGKLTTEGFVILKDSRISTSEVNSCPEYLKKNRQKIFQQGKITKDGKVKEDILFNSPSGASSFAIGGSSNGLIEWKDKNGKTLKELENK